MDILTNKVHAFLRHQMDTIQEAALEELSESHEIYRDAQALKDIKTVLAFEIEREDLTNITEQINEDVEKVNDDNDLLTRELSETIRENTRLGRVISNLEEKMSLIYDEKEYLQESLVALEEEVSSDFESTEKAIVITENVDAPVRNTTPQPMEGNPFLTDEVMAYMPNSNN
jgi:chromosome segregation ATPase